MLVLFFLIGIFVVTDIVRGYFKAKDKKKYLVSNLTGTAIVVVLLFLFGPLFALSPIKLGYSALKGENVTLYYPAGRIDFARAMMEKIKTAEKDNRDFYKTTTSMPIVMAFSKLDMLRFGAPPDAGGVGNELAVIVNERKASVNVIAHEMSHRNLRAVVGKTLAFPNWFDEGLSSYIGKMNYYANSTDLKKELEEGRYHRDITKLRGVFGTSGWLKIVFLDKRSRSVYGQTYEMVKYLIDKYGQDRVYNFVLSVKNTDFDTAFKNSFGLTPEEFHQEFINNLQTSP